MRGRTIRRIVFATCATATGLIAYEAYKIKQVLLIYLIFFYILT